MIQMIERNYNEVRSQMQQGDLICFGGKGEVSNTIKWVTNSHVSHVGCVYQSWDDLEGTKRVRLIESTQLNGVTGVVTPFMSERIPSYDGEMWWCPLNEKLREYFDEDAFFKFMFSQEGKPYDVPQAIGSALDSLDIVFENDENYSKLFCSELVTAGHKKAFEKALLDNKLDVNLWNMIEPLKNINPSETTPADMTHFRYYETTYYQIKGERKEIEFFNK